MTNTKNTKRALLSSVMALFLCFAMLLGTTYAWFTDSVTSSNNIIKTGNLIVDLEVLDKDAGTWTSVKESKAAIFDYDNWEPGYVQTKVLRVQNEGTLALKWKATLVSENGVSDLAKVIDVYVKAWGVLDDATVASEVKYPTDRNLEGYTNVGTLYDFIANIETTTNGVLKAGENAYLGIAFKMQESAGNEYQNKKLGEFDLQILATQYTAESDSFDDQYDADATFGTYIELEAGADLLAAMASAQADMPLTIKLNGDVEWLTEGHHGENDITPASSIVIDGNGYTITATGSGVTPLGDTEAPMTLKNVKIVDNSVSYAEDAWEFSYLEMGGKVLNCVNVDFADPIMVESDVATFTNCSFLGYYDTTNDIKMNGVWMANGDATFTNCTFTGTRGMKICDMYAPEVGTVVIDGCTFMDLTQKPGVAIDDEDTQDMKITIKNSTFINCQPGDQGLYVYETDNTVPTVENNIVESYTELVEIATKDQLVAFANRVNGGDGMSGVLVKLTDNIDLAGMEWTPIGQTGTSYGATSYFGGIFDGQGYTISNMTITQTNDGEHYAAGFFGFIDGAAVTIRNVNFDKAKVNGHHWTGVVAGYLTGNIDNCNVTNSTVTCTHANDDACGDKAGAVVGYVNSGLVNNCSVSDTTVSAGRDAGQVVGASKTAYVANCTATNVNVSAAGDCTGANINNDIIGRNLD